MKEYSKRGVSLITIERLNEIGYKYTKKIDINQIITWFEIEKFIGIELVLDLNRKWIWRITPLNDKSELQEQIFTDQSYSFRLDAIEDSIMILVNKLKEIRNNGSK